VWPPRDPRPANSAPILDNNGDGSIDNADDFPNARQAYDPSSGWYVNDPVAGYITSNQASASQFYAVSGYETAPVKSISGDRRELRYALFWTAWGLTGGGNANDDPRQLGYTDPHESTVVTWNSFFREYDDNGGTLQGKKDIVLFLGGAARPYDSKLVTERSYRVMP
jgi:hypothetical protein